MDSPINPMDPRFSRELELFGAALQIADSQARAAFLNEQCSGDVELRQNVQALLDAHEQANTFLDQPAADARPASRSGDDFPQTEKPGDRIGRYKLLQVVGEGGMGIVYMAEQEEPVRRRVALKIIKLGMDTRQVIARFEAERQALALMDHPNIAKVLDGGATEAGRPYFVMELVQGVPITQFCDKNKLATKQRLDLFIQVCHAIQSAHQKGIIHRDIKPSNVLVTLHDGVPVPKVIDFGIAKATHQKLTEKTLFTNFSTMIGTPAYMSPEQAEMSGLDIDTRTDVYALGVLLYELLTGTTPFPEKRLRSLAYGEMQRVIMEEDPQTPSTRLSTMANEEKTAVAKSLSQDLTSLSKLLKGDLDWVVMKCLEKDRGRRYETANSIASDLRRLQGNEPVNARPPSIAYRFQKMVRRNRLAFGATGLVAAALLLGLAGSAWQAVRATRAEHKQVALRVEAETAKLEETKQRSVSEQRLYDSLVREARALRLARRMGYRDEVFSLIRHANALSGVQKDVDALRREAVACMGDFVGSTPLSYTNFPSDFRVMAANLDPSGKTIAFRLVNRAQKKEALLLRAVPAGQDLALSPLRDRSILTMEFFNTNQLAVISIPAEDVEKPRWQRTLHAQVTIWSRGAKQNWTENSPQWIPGAFELVVASSGPMIGVDDFSGGAVQFLDITTKSPRFSIPVSPRMKGLPRLFVSNTGSFLALETASSPEDPKFEGVVWDLDTGREVQSFAFESETVVGISADGRNLILSAAYDNRLSVYGLKTTNTIFQVPDFMQTMFQKGPGLMPGRDILALSSVLRRGVRLLDYTRQETIATLDEANTVFAMSFSADGRSMLVAGADHARVFDFQPGNEIMMFRGHAGGANGLLVPDGSRAISVPFNTKICLWSAQTGAQLLEKEFVDIESLRMSSQGDFFCAGSAHTQEIFFVNSTNGEIFFKIGSTNVGSVQSIALSADNRYLAAASRRIVSVTEILESWNETHGSLSVWELEYSSASKQPSGAKLIQTLQGPYSGVAFVPKSTRVAFYDFAFGPDAHLWDFTRTNAPQTLSLKLRWDYESLGPTIDGRALWTVDTLGRVVCFDLATSQEVAALGQPSDRRDAGGSCNISLSPDGTKLAVPTMADMGVEIFDTIGRRSLYNLPGRDGTPWNLSWSSDSQRLLVTRSNGDMALWDLAQVDQTLFDLGLPTSSSLSAK